MIISIVIRFTGVRWLNRLMPAVIIGPTVAIIGLGHARNAIGDLIRIDVVPSHGAASPSYIALACGLITLFVTMLCSTYGNKRVRLIPFILGILAGYATAAIFTVIGNLAGIEAFEALGDLPVHNVEIETPIEKCKTPKLAGRKLAIVPILRAGLGDAGDRIFGTK